MCGPGNQMNILMNRCIHGCLIIVAIWTWISAFALASHDFLHSACVQLSTICRKCLWGLFISFYGQKHCSKYFLLGSAEESMSHMFGMTSKWWLNFPLISSTYIDRRICFIDCWKNIVRLENEYTVYTVYINQHWCWTFVSRSRRTLVRLLRICVWMWSLRLDFYSGFIITTEFWVTEHFMFAQIILNHLRVKSSSLGMLGNASAARQGKHHRQWRRDVDGEQLHWETPDRSQLKSVTTKMTL